MNIFNSGFKRFSFIILKVIVISCLLIYLFSVLDLKSLYNTVLASDFYLVSAAIILLPLNILLQFYKWKLSCRFYLSENDNKRILNSLFAGFPAAVYTPARIGEYVGRGIEFRDKKLADITSAVFFDKFFTLFIVMLTGAAGAVIIFNVPLFYGLLFLLFIGITVLITLKYNYLIRIPKVRLPDLAFSSRMLFLSLLFYLCYLFQFVLLLAAFTDKHNTIILFSAASVIMFTKTMIPNLISGELGIRESASVFFLSYIGDNPAAGFNASVLLFVINLAIPSLIGLIPFLRKKV